MGRVAVEVVKKAEQCTLSLIYFRLSPVLDPVLAACTLLSTMVTYPDLPSPFSTMSAANRITQVLNFAQKPPALDCSEGALQADSVLNIVLELNSGHVTLLDLYNVASLPNFFPVVGSSQSCLSTSPRGMARSEDYPRILSTDSESADSESVSLRDLIPRKLSVLR
jgi:hypothetical protein